MASDISGKILKGLSESQRAAGRKCFCCIFKGRAD